SSLARYRRNWRTCWIAWRMLDKRVLGWNLVSKNLVSKSEAASQRWAAGYNEGINSEQIVLMKSRIFLFLVAFHILAGALIGQTAQPASTPAAQDSPSKTGAPPDSKAQA